MFRLMSHARWALVALALIMAPASAAGQHRWAWGDQHVDNNGGDSVLNVWKPNVAPGDMSLSQQWYVGSGEGLKQTVEGGWQVYPGKYNTADPMLFIFYTPDNYATGCYNLDCKAFVQVNNSWVLGGRLAPVSTDGGTQYIIRMQWQLNHGKWWLFVQGAGGYVAVGYYPVSVFNGGQMSRNAQIIRYGGESAANASGQAGQMGSGKLANAGWTHAAYQRTIYYIDTSLVGHWANLTPHQPSAPCYTIDMNNNTAGAWATYFFFGGPKCP